VAGEQRHAAIDPLALAIDSRQARNATGGAFLRQGGAWSLASALHGGSIWRPTKNRGFLRFSRTEIKLDQSTLS
jgi:hypothetical protein